MSSRDLLPSNKFFRQLSGDTSTPILLIHPPNWEYEGELWYDLYDVIMQEWESVHGETIGKRFSIESWTDDFIALGFHSTILSEVARVFGVLYQKFGTEIVNLILSYESVGDIAGLVLSGEVDYLSTQMTTKEGEKKKTATKKNRMKEESLNPDWKVTHKVKAPHPQGFLSLLSQMEPEKHPTMKMKIQLKIQSPFINHSILAQNPTIPNGFTTSIISLQQKESN